MSDDATGSGFGKFVPGFDFLQSLAKGAAQSIPQMPGLGGWVAPTLSVEELDKRITELKAVQFWLDQNAMALKATIQALEVQKMTLATLKGMNVSMAEVAKAFTPKPAEAAAPAPRVPERTPEPPPAPATQAAPADASDDADATEASDKPAAGVVDPMQWWGALTQQFQQIAATAMKDAAERAAPVVARSQAAKPAPASTSAKPAARKRAKPAPAKKAPARKRPS
ncbi:PhaM family polyhydroxyalkanoate granule multifunctional regulatory protein [Pseudorhodoferax sp. Leaf267]|uniref:PhaM family polyhydroxyalkanoate granule multifunctional regulatory protein n=1 Tax=Pseudorhodoferax sp. Leaf267 TaxID=1736316 RepID=UPI0006FAAD87|nr:PhaM family polyhydroxyalkanoate granule multifunctional regulatory protein [Pseudorhodoferax sp. Leaf267]KQP12563.1 hypothetical protein ASF43_20140 [Pseudorhodoferax sp. Leaf267]